MELAVSAVAGEVVSRFISFLANKYYHWYTDENQQLETRLHQLLLRVRMVVEEADGRRITNSGMLSQLKTFADAMYRAYWALAAFRYSRSVDEEVQASISSSSSPLIKRSRSTAAHNHGGRASAKSKYLVDLQGAVERLEIAVANMAEFVVILGGCELRRRQPYDAHLYIDNFMFGRHAEKQELSNFLLLPHTHNHRLAAAPPPVLAIIGAFMVGKKTLAAHVCNDERVRSRFSLVLRLHEADFSRITADHAGGLVSEKKKKTLLVVEFVSEVDEADWTKFYSAVATAMGRGSKVVILSRHKKSEKFATVKPIFLSVLSFEEFSYLFKTLAFGAANQLEHPRLLRVADELARDMQSEWSLVTANLLADVLRKNLNLHFWISMLSRLRRVADRNFSMFGEHPKLLLERGHGVVVTDFFVCSALSSTDDVPMKKNLPKITFEELFMDPGVRPKVEFGLFTWESRLPPYTSFDKFVSSCVQGMPGGNTLSPRKRRWAPF